MSEIWLYFIINIERNLYAVDKEESHGTANIAVQVWISLNTGYLITDSAGFCTNVNIKCN